tara:strand:+ start:141 stop:266 length:126 start_codon:yes stop_codon:yes gene_type:complete
MRTKKTTNKNKKLSSSQKKYNFLMSRNLLPKNKLKSNKKKK